jgi:hypothetical protein
MILSLLISLLHVFDNKEFNMAASMSSSASLGALPRQVIPDESPVEAKSDQFPMDLSAFGVFPDELLLFIFSLLKPSELTKVPSVCGRFKRVVSSHPDLKMMKEKLLPAMQKREIDQVEFATGLNWGMVAQTALNELIRLEKLKTNNQGINGARLMQTLPNHMPFAQGDCSLDMDLIYRKEYHYLSSQFNSLIIDLDNSSTFTDKKLTLFFKRMNPTSLTIKGGDEAKLAILMPHLIAKAPALLSLDVSHSCITEEQFTSLITSATGLKNLFISGQDISFVAIASNCPDLEILIGYHLKGHLDLFRGTVQVLSDGLSFPKLKVLEYSFEFRTDRGDSHFIKNCPNLEQLCVSANPIELETIMAILQNCTKLKSVDIAGIEPSELISRNFVNFAEILSFTTIENLCTTVPITDLQRDILFQFCSSLKCYKVKGLLGGPQPVMKYDSYYRREESGIVKYVDVPPTIPTIEMLKGSFILLQSR